MEDEKYEGVTVSGYIGPGPTLWDRFKEGLLVS